MQNWLKRILLRGGPPGSLPRFHLPTSDFRRPSRQGQTGPIIKSWARLDKKTIQQVEYKYLLCGVNGEPKDWEVQFGNFFRVDLTYDLTNNDWYFVWFTRDQTHKKPVEYAHRRSLYKYVQIDYRLIGLWASLSLLITNDHSLPMMLTWKLFESTCRKLFLMVFVYVMFVKSIFSFYESYVTGDSIPSPMC